MFSESCALERNGETYDTEGSMGEIPGGNKWDYPGVPGGNGKASFRAGKGIGGDCGGRRGQAEGTDFKAEEDPALLCSFFFSAGGFDPEGLSAVGAGHG